jgi:dipeptidase
MMKVVPHPQHSPDLAPCDFLLFPKMNTKLKGRKFDTVEEIQAETQMVLNTLTKKNFQDAFQKWQKCWDRCVCSQRDYFDGDGAE